MGMMTNNNCLRTLKSTYRLGTALFRNYKYSFVAIFELNSVTVHEVWQRSSYNVMINHWPQSPSFVIRHAISFLLFFFFNLFFKLFFIDFTRLFRYVSKNFILFKKKKALKLYNNSVKQTKFPKGVGVKKWLFES